MKSPEQARADFEDAKEQLILRLMLFWYGIKAGYFGVFPHRHTFAESDICTRCFRHISDPDLFR